MTPPYDETAALNPHPSARATEGAVRTHDLPPVHGGNDRLRLRHELVRKLIHLATLAVPLLVWLLPRTEAAILLTTGVVAALAVEVARSRLRWARYHFLRRTRPLLRRNERKGLAGATYMAIGYLTAFLLFPLPIAVLAMLYIAFGDAAAAIVGKRWGRHRTSWGKSWEGAAAGFAVNLAAGTIVPGLPFFAILAGAFAAAVLEFLPLPLDDNLRVTLGGGAVAWGAMALGVALG